MKRRTWIEIVNAGSMFWIYMAFGVLFEFLYLGWRPGKPLWTFLLLLVAFGVMIWATNGIARELKIGRFADGSG